MDTAYNRRIASINDAIMNRAARHSAANFVGKGYGSDSGLNTQYNDVMRGAANQPRALSQAEREYRMEGEAKEFRGSGVFDDFFKPVAGMPVAKMGSGVFDDIGQAFRYTPIGMASDAIQGRDTVFSGRGGAGYGGAGYGGAGYGGAGYGGAGYGGAGYGGNAAAMVGTTMPYREVPDAGVIDHARSGAGMKYPANKVVQVGNSDGSGKPQVEAAWYENFDDFSNGRNRMRDSKKIGRMTKDPEMVASGGRDFSEWELDFVKDLFKKSGGAGFYGGEWYNDWDDFTEAVKGAYDTVKGVWEDYVKPVLDVVGTPVKDMLISSGNPYGEAGAGVLELLGYGEGGMYGRPSGMSGGKKGYHMMPDGSMMKDSEDCPYSGGMYGAPSGRSGGRLVKGSPEAKAYMASIRKKRGSKGGMMGCGEGVFADAKPIAANSLGFSPKLEVEQLNAATGSVSYGDMPSSNPVGSGRRRTIVPKNSRGVSSAPSKMGELEGGITFAEIVAMGRDALENIIAPAAMGLANAIVSGAVRAPGAVADAARSLKRAYNRQDVQVLLRFAMDNIKLIIPYLPTPYKVGATALLMLKAYLDTPAPEVPPQRDDEEDDDLVVVGRGKKPRVGEGRDTPSAIRPDPIAEQRKYEREMAEKFYEQMDKEYSEGKKPRVGEGINEDLEKLFKNSKNAYSDITKEIENKVIPLGNKMKGGKISRKTAMKEREGLAVSGDNSMGAIVAERGYSKKAQKKSGAVVEDASKDLWKGSQFENLTGRSGTKNPSLVLEGGAMSGGSHGLIQQNNLQAVRGGSMTAKRMMSEYSGKGVGGRKSAYNEFVSKMMKETGMKMAECVKHIKQNGLYKKK